MSSGLVVTETTNDVYLADVYIPMTVQVRARVICTHDRTGMVGLYHRA